MESLLPFGPGGQLLGVLSDADASGQRPIVVLPSAGLLPRAGPFRLHVDMSRRLADLGISSFRFDVPGVGEAPRLKGCGAREATLAAFDRLTASRRHAAFVVGGVCSAADVAWRVAVDDQRVRGVLMLDGLSYTGPWYRFAAVLGALKRPVREWPDMAVRFSQRARAAPRPVIEDYRDWPDRDQAQREFLRLVDRDVRSLWVYTGGYNARFLHPRQFGWSFGSPAGDRRVVMHHWPDCDHTYFSKAHRERLLNTVEDWLVSNFLREPVTT